MADSENKVAPVYSLAELFEQADRDADNRYRARQEGRHLGPVTGFVQLDRALGGILEPGIHIVHGQPGVGKTAFALNVAQACGCACLFITCEMSALALLKRLTANVTQTYLNRLSSGEYDQARLRALYERAAVASPNLRILDVTQCGVTWARVQEGYDGLKASTGLQILVIVDSLHSLADRMTGQLQEYEALNKTLADLRDLAAINGAPILTVSERNRASMTGGGLNAGAGTRRIEYGAESVIDLARDRESQPDYDGWIDVPVTLDKNRHGPAGAKIGLRFSGRLQQYIEAVA